MLHEYALDPSVLASWPSFRYFFENFGVDKGRIISQYPKKWKRLVYEACVGCGDMERKKIEERLAMIDDKLFRCTVPFDPNTSWAVNAVGNRSSFKAVICAAGTVCHDNILIADELDEEHFLWGVARETTVLRTAQAMADCASRLLANSKDILFIDPHLDLEKPRYRNTLKSFLDKIPPSDKVHRIEYHTSDSNGHSADHFRGLVERFTSSIAIGIAVTFVRWRENSGGDSLHPRYILTNLGGMRFEHGLDEEPGGATTDVSLLAPSLLKTRWDDYQKNTASFQYLDEVVMSGRKQTL